MIHLLDQRLDLNQLFLEKTIQVGIKRLLRSLISSYMSGSMDYCLLDLFDLTHLVTIGIHLKSLLILIHCKGAKDSPLIC